MKLFCERYEATVSSVHSPCLKGLLLNTYHQNRIWRCSLTKAKPGNFDSEGHLKFSSSQMPTKKMTSDTPGALSPSSLSPNDGHTIDKDFIDIGKVMKNPIDRSDPNRALLFIFCHNRNKKPVGTFYGSVLCVLNVRLKRFA